MEQRSIAIDGPAGAGKSTLARALAKEIGYLYVDTGAIYRTVALRCKQVGADPSDPEQVAPLLEGLDLRMAYGEDGVQHMYLSGEDVSEAIRHHEISGMASQVAALPQVRAFLLDFQRRQAREGERPSPASQPGSPSLRQEQEERERLRRALELAKQTP